MLKLEVGKIYINSNGQKVRILCTDRKIEPGGVTVLGLVDREFCEDHRWYTSDGKHFNDAFDLVKEYKEPKIHKRDIVWWCNNSDRAIYSSIIEVGKRLNFGALDAKELHRETVSYTEES